MTPFETDFLSTMPNWLSGSTKKPTILSRSTGSTTLRYSMIGTIPKLVITAVLMGSAGVVGVVDAVGDERQITNGTSAVHAEMRDQADIDWNRYLARLEAPTGRFTSTHVGAVRAVWAHFRGLAPNLSPPQTAPTEEGLLSMVWDAGEHHLEVDVASNRKVGWFYTNRTTGTYESREGSLATYLPRRLDEIVKNLA